MKKSFVILLIVLTVASLGLVAGYVIYEKAIASPQAPVISFEEELLKVTTDASDKDLLKGVTATDPEDGDVSDSVLIESISNIFSENCVKVTYVAFDSKNHMGRGQRTVQYTDYEPPTFSLSHAMVFRLSSTLDILNYIGAEDVFDGDISHKVIYSFANATTGFTIQGEHDVELRVTNSKGGSSHLNLTVELTDREPNSADIQLKDYLIYLPVGAEFKPADYFKSYVSNGNIVTDMSGISVSSDVDTEKPGTYTVTYSNGSGDSRSRTRLIVVVE